MVIGRSGHADRRDHGLSKRAHRFRSTLRYFAVLNIEVNRRTNKYPPREQIGRVLWWFGKLIFKLTPRPFHLVRRIILRIFGARIGRAVQVYPDVDVFFPWKLTIGDWSALGSGVRVYNLGQITIGERATISQRAHLCAGSHDYSMPDLPLIKSEVQIGDDVWIATEAFIGPGVHVGTGAIAGARAVVVKSVPEWTIVVGNPAAPIKKRVLHRSAVPSRS